MVDIQKLTASIKNGEGTGPIQNGRFMPYKDSLGLITIGWGRCIQLVGITQDEAETLLSNDLLAIQREAETQDWWSSVSDNDNRSNAMLELLFILGLPKLNKFINALTALRKLNFDAAADEFLDSELHRQDGKRIERLAEMIKTG